MASTTYILMLKSGAHTGQGGLLCTGFSNPGFFLRGSSGPREVRLI